MTDTPGTLEERLRDEADLCRNDGADDCAQLLDEAADEIASLRARVEVMRRLLDNVGGFLDDFAQADLDEGAADAVTVGMVYQQQAQTVLLPRITQALKATPVE